MVHSDPRKPTRACTLSSQKPASEASRALTRRLVSVVQVLQRSSQKLMCSNSAVAKVGVPHSPTLEGLPGLLF